MTMRRRLDRAPAHIRGASCSLLAPSEGGANAAGGALANVGDVHEM
jgi:hypothetical protein